MTGPSGRRCAGALLVVLLLTASTACTGSATPSPPPAASPSGTPAPAPASVPLRVQVTHLSGRLPTGRSRVLVAGVRRTLASYVDAAFLSGTYPRSDFSGAFSSSFTSGAARRAGADASLLTNRSLGRSTRSVRATRRTAYLSVLAPQGKVAGVTAAVDLVFLVDRGDRARQRVHLHGRLLLTRGAAGGWRIFGYDVSRSQIAVGGAS